MRNFRQLALMAGLVTLMFVASTRDAEASRFVSRSPVQTATFVYPIYGGMFGYAVMRYSWQGMAVVDYTRSGNTVHIQKIDQTVSMFGVARSGNPCGVTMNISTEVLSPSACYRTFYPTASGSYISNPDDMLRGGVCYPDIWPRSPTVRVTARSLATGGNLGSNTLSWSFTLP
jgi:hypothetical protein